MQIPPEIVIKNITTTPAIDKLISRGIARLEKVCAYIISTRLALEQTQGRHRKGNPYRMRIDIRIPDRADIVVQHSSKALKKPLEGRLRAQSSLEVEPVLKETRPIAKSPVSKGAAREEPLPALIRRTFDSARRELEKAVDRQHGKVKTPAQQENQAIVEKIFREQQYGFLGTLDGQQVYFHKNSVLHKHWENLRVGTVVRYTPEVGEKGIQASTVEPLNKPGAVEIHGQLHDFSI